MAGSGGYGASGARSAVTVRRSPGDLYRFWRDLENLPRFMTHLRAVEATGDGRSHWVARGPAGDVEWDAEIVSDEPGRRLAWRSIEGSAVGNAGEVRFDDAPGGRGTEIRVRIRYRAPGGRVGNAVAKLFGDHPTQQMRDDLRRCKQVLETGEVVVSSGTPEGAGGRGPLTQRPAEPLPDRSRR